MIIECDHCGKDIFRYPKDIKRAKKHYCNQKCFNLSGGVRDENNPRWKGDNVGYTALHKWIRKKIKKPKFCQLCHKRPAKELANVSYKYKRELNDWIYLCYICHRIKDGTINNLKNYKNKSGN